MLLQGSPGEGTLCLGALLFLGLISRELFALTLPFQLERNELNQLGKESLTQAAGDHTFSPGQRAQGQQRKGPGQRRWPPVPPGPRPHRRGGSVLPAPHSAAGLSGTGGSSSGAARTERGQAGPVWGTGCQSAICVQVTAGDAALEARRSGLPYCHQAPGPAGGVPRPKWQEAFR